MAKIYRNRKEPYTGNDEKRTYFYTHQPPEWNQNPAYYPDFIQCYGNAMLANAIAHALVPENLEAGYVYPPGYTGEKWYSGEDTNIVADSPFKPGTGQTIEQKLDFILTNQQFIISALATIYTQLCIVPSAKMNPPGATV